MPDQFDPYLKWLGIKPSDQPPNDYRLLAIDLFEDDPDIIENAADQRMAYLRSLQMGDHAALSQQILNEIAAAKIRLLNPNQKAAYDAALRSSLPPRNPIPIRAVAPSVPPAQEGIQPGVRPVPTPTEAAGGVDTGTFSSLSMAKRARRNRRSVVRLAGHVVAAVVGLALGWLILQWVRADRAETTIAAKKAVNEEPANPVGSDASDRQTPRRSEGEDPFQLEHEIAASSALPSNSPPTLPEATATADDPVSDLPETKSPPKAQTPPVAEPAASPVEQIDTLTATRNEALSGGDLAAALSAAGQMADLEGQDAITAKLAVLKEFRQANSDQNAFPRLAEETLALLDDAIEAGRQDVAEEIAELGLLTARESEDLVLMRLATLGVLKAREIEENSLSSKPEPKTGDDE